MSNLKKLSSGKAFAEHLSTADAIKLEYDDFFISTNKRVS